MIRLDLALILSLVARSGSAATSPACERHLADARQRA